MPTAPTLEAIRYSAGRLELLNQLKLPESFEYDTISSAEEGWHAIRSMKVRGAPAIAIAAALSLACEAKAKRNDFKSATEALKFLREKLEYLKTSRPTAVNLFEAAERLEREISTFAGTLDTSATSGQKILDCYVTLAEAMLEKDKSDNQKIGNAGADFILKGKNGSVKVLTHCNTGSLATAAFGTALGIVRALHARGRLAHAFATETRPYNQGARLTAFELVYEKIPGTLIADSMAAFLMMKHEIDAVVVGVDRMTRNGDTANKIGTYQLAIAAHHHGVPFLVAAPSTSIDLKLQSGREIHIEERPAEELTHLKGQRIAADGIQVWNPSFDVTPARLITAIVTEFGVIQKPTEHSEFDVAKFLHEKGVT